MIPFTKSLRQLSMVLFWVLLHARLQFASAFAMASAPFVLSFAAFRAGSLQKLSLSVWQRFAQRPRGPRRAARLVLKAVRALEIASRSFWASALMHLSVFGLAACAAPAASMLPRSAPARARDVARIIPLVLLRSPTT